MPRPAVQVEEVDARLQKLRLRRIEDYPGNVHVPFLVRCLDCPREWPIKYASLYAPNRKRGCSDCSYVGRNADLAVRPEDAVADLRRYGREPLENFPGLKQPWRSRCLTCGTISTPSLNNIRHTRGPSCDECAKKVRGAKRRLDADTGVSVMRARGLEPAVLYPGSGVPWRSRCVAKGHEVFPTYDNVKAGNGGCVHCAPFGIDLVGPAVVYVLHHPRLDALKVGIAKAAPAGKVSRVQHLCRKYGWKEYARVALPTGAVALEVEARVLSHFAGRTRFLSRDQTEGWTETLSADCISLPDLLRLVQAAARDAA